MRRCIDLANLAKNRVGLNPNVGALLVYNDRIIGEGYYQKFGGKHAEVNAFENVKQADKHFIPQASLYVSLEPCNIFGKTPPCTHRILKEEVKRVIVGCVDPNPKIAGKSLEFLSAQGIKIIPSILEEECQQLIKPFKINILKNRPFISLKFAQSKDYFIGRSDKQVWLTNTMSKTFSHKLRAENHAILIGTTTALLDNPSLTNRIYAGSSPLRIVIDKDNRIPSSHSLISDNAPLLLLNHHKREDLGQHKEQWSGPIDLKQILHRLYEEKSIGRLLVEGGAKTINGFIAEGLWDQCYVFSTNRILRHGIKAPNVVGKLIEKRTIGNDSLVLIEAT